VIILPEYDILNISDLLALIKLPQTTESET